MKELEHQLRLELSRVNERTDKLVEFLDSQHDQQTVSDTQVSLAETQFMMLETYYVLIEQRIKDLKKGRR